MIRISTIFIAICMVLVSASLGMVLYAMAGISGSESAIVALTALTCMILYNAVSMRLRDRTDVGDQIADLSRGTADLARQVAEFGRRLIALEQRLGAQQEPASPASNPIQRSGRRSWSGRSTEMPHSNGPTAARRGPGRGPLPRFPGPVRLILSDRPHYCSTPCIMS